MLVKEQVSGLTTGTVIEIELRDSGKKLKGRLGTVSENSFQLVTEHKKTPVVRDLNFDDVQVNQVKKPPRLSRGMKVLIAVCALAALIGVGVANNENS
jgi:hypothetical protein